MKEKFVLISMDAMISEDIAYLQTLPAFKWLIEQGSMVKGLKCIYPSLTYPCHATMATGNFPRKHGIINNTQMVPGNSKPPWLLYHEAYQCKDYLMLVKKKG